MPRFSIPSVFIDIVSSYALDASLVKPSPFAVSMLAAKHGVEPSDAVVVGDAENDMQMAIAAGATPIAVLTGHLSAEQATELGIRYIIPDVTHLENILRMT